MVTSGCSLQLKDLKRHFKKPWAILIGMGCQYIFLPLIAFCVLLSFSLEPNQAIAVMITSTCPGGPLSNLGTIAIEGDITLR